MQRKRLVKHPKISYLKEGGKKETGCEAGAKQMKACKHRWASFPCIARDEWISQLGVGCFGGRRWCRQTSIYACKYGCKICDEFIWNQSIHQQNCSQQSMREKQTILQVVEKEAYLLEGNWTTGDRTHKCLQNCQSARTGFSIKYHNTIRYRESLQQTQQIHNMTSVLTSFFRSACIPNEYLWWKQWVGRS